MAFELRRLSAQVDSSPFPTLLSEDSWDFEEEEDEEYDGEEEVSTLSSVLEDQADLFDEISSRVLDVSYADQDSEEPSEPVAIHLARVFALLRSTLGMALGDAVTTFQNLSASVQTFSDGIVLDDEESADAVYEMAVDAFNEETERMQKMQDAVFAAIEDVEEALEGAEDDEVE